jgi:rubrerythrin
MEFNQSRTYQNLQAAFERELQVSTLYSIYADRAVDDGFIEISNNFLAVVRNEKEHARIFLRTLNNGLIPDTETNLAYSASLELATGDLYRGYARIAQEEGYTDIAALFNGIANIELNHNLLFETEHENVVTDQVFCKPESTLWICIQCGNILSGVCAPEVCPICGFPQGYYRVFQGSEL